LWKRLTERSQKLEKHVSVLRSLESEALKLRTLARGQTNQEEEIAREQILAKVVEVQATIKQILVSVEKEDRFSVMINSLMSSG